MVNNLNWVELSFFPVTSNKQLETNLNMAKKIKNNGDWFLVDIVERAEMVGDDKTNPNRRCLTWTNTVLIQADSISDAYDKAIAIGRKNYSMRYKAASGKICSWTVLGLSSLVPIYEDIEDGSELAFTDEGAIAAKTSERMIKSKKEILSSFSKR